MFAADGEQAVDRVAVLVRRVADHDRAGGGELRASRINAETALTAAAGVRIVGPARRRPA